MLNLLWMVLSLVFHNVNGFVLSSENEVNTSEWALIKNSTSSLRPQQVNSSSDLTTNDVHDFRFWVQDYHYLGSSYTLQLIESPFSASIAINRFLLLSINRFPKLFPLAPGQSTSFYLGDYKLTVTAIWPAGKVLWTMGTIANALGLLIDQFANDKRLDSHTFEVKIHATQGQSLVIKMTSIDAAHFELKKIEADSSYPIRILGTAYVDERLPQMDSFKVIRQANKWLQSNDQAAVVPMRDRKWFYVGSVSLVILISDGRDTRLLGLTYGQLSSALKEVADFVQIDLEGRWLAMTVSLVQNPSIGIDGAQIYLSTSLQNPGIRGASGSGFGNTSLVA